MENKKKKYLVMAAMAIVGVLGSTLTYLSAQGLHQLNLYGSANTIARPPQNFSQGSPQRCEQLYLKIYGSGASTVAPYTAAEKFEYEKYCKKAPVVLTCAQLKVLIDNKTATQDQIAEYTRCKSTTTTPPPPPPCGPTLTANIPCTPPAGTPPPPPPCGPTLTANIPCTPPAGTPPPPPPCGPTLTANIPCTPPAGTPPPPPPCGPTLTANIPCTPPAGTPPPVKDPCYELKTKLLNLQPGSLEYNRYYDLYIEKCGETPKPENPGLTPCEDLRMQMAKAKIGTEEYRKLKARFDAKCGNPAGEKPKPENQGENNPCVYIRTELLKYKEGTPEYKKLKAAFEKYRCGNPAGEKPKPENPGLTPCEDLRMQMAKAKIGTEEHRKLKARFDDRCGNPTGETPKPENPGENDPCVNIRAELLKYKEGTPEYDTLKAQFNARCQNPPSVTNDDKKPDCTGTLFPDVNCATPEGKAADELNFRGIFKGDKDGKFNGRNSITKAEAITVILRACKRNAEGNGTFRDVGSDQWFRKIVGAAAEQGIAKGNPDGSFRPLENVNRATFTTMFVRACKIDLNLEHNFRDVSLTDSFAPYVGAAWKYAIFPESIKDNQFKPAKFMTRADTAIAIYQYLTNSQSEIEVVK